MKTKPPTVCLLQGRLNCLGGDALLVEREYSIGIRRSFPLFHYPQSNVLSVVTPTIALATVCLCVCAPRLPYLRSLTGSLDISA